MLRTLLTSRPSSSSSVCRHPQVCAAVLLHQRCRVGLAADDVLCLLHAAQPDRWLLWRSVATKVYNAHWTCAVDHGHADQLLRATKRELCPLRPHPTPSLSLTHTDWLLLSSSSPCSRSSCSCSRDAWWGSARRAIPPSLLPSSPICTWARRGSRCSAYSILLCLLAG